MSNQDNAIENNQQANDGLQEITQEIKKLEDSILEGDTHEKSLEDSIHITEFQKELLAHQEKIVTQIEQVDIGTIGKEKKSIVGENEKMKKEYTPRAEEETVASTEQIARHKTTAAIHVEKLVSATRIPSRLKAKQNITYKE